MWAFLGIIVVGGAFLAIGGFLYFDLSRGVGEIEDADDAPHAIIKQVEESRIENRDNKDLIRRITERIDHLESRKLTVSEGSRAL